MKKIILLAGTLLFLVACSKTPTARISATIEGASDTTVVLQKLNFNRLQPVDTIKTDAAGHFEYKVKLTGAAPYFYYLYFGENQIASLVLLDGDNVKLNASTIGGYKVEGSQESLKLQELNTMYGKAFNTLDALATQALKANADEVKGINSKLGKAYIDYRREVTKFVIDNPYSIASAVAVFQKFNENLPVFGEPTDIIILNRVCDSLATVYPSSEYVAALRDEISRRDNMASFANKLNNAVAQGFPEISLPDVNGEIKTLSEIKDKVVIVLFWSVSQDDHKMFNNDLLKLYEKYSSKGLEIYQISLDIDKPVWASTVKSQGLPWISVNDGLGVDSPAVVACNLNSIPSMFLINKAGDLVGTDVFDADKLEELIKKNL